MDKTNMRYIYFKDAKQPHLKITTDTAEKIILAIIENKTHYYKYKQNNDGVTMDLLICLDEILYIID